jgi:tRNA threonylcarbamoyladenosine biosynthesis protein TsaB
MLLLAIDTAGPDCAVALARSGSGRGEILVRASEWIGRGHAERLMPMFEAALEEGGVGFADLDRIAVTTGPGSFTGVRVGIAAARGLALALDIPAVGVCSLDALALPVPGSHKQGTVVAVLDAKRGEIYALARDIASGDVLIRASALRLEDLAGKLGRAQRPLVLVGSGAPIVAGAFSESEVQIAGTAESPDIADVAVLGLIAEKSASPKPLYARGADAKPQAYKALARL